jgi:lipoprotein-releasing system ATP-binding protein
MQHDPLLRLVAVSKGFATGAAAPFAVLRGVSLEIQRGESVAVVGPSGCGKSTFLNLLGALDRPDEGEVWLGGRNIAALDEEELAAVRSQQIGFVFQSHFLLPQCSVMENVLVPTLACADAALRASAPARAEELLARVGLGSRLHHRSSQLSGGERQRAAVVRALINRPALLLADEPTGSLDQASAIELGRLLAELNRDQGVTLVVVTHAAELAGKMSRMLELRGGKLEESARRANAGN